RSVPLKRINRGTEPLDAGATLDDGLAVVADSCPRTSATQRKHTKTANAVMNVRRIEAPPLRVARKTVPQI
ncbi:MAG: hypothetical protein LAO07_15465, partial [Acidobacteriia bacterium]|nr:hypothetical protein [Terriglobia bacterium]